MEQKVEQKVESRRMLNVVLAQGAIIVELLAGKNQTLLVQGNMLLFLNLDFDVANALTGLH